MSNAGVYAITNRTTNRVYIGGSTRMQDRWYDHRKKASDGRHRSASFQQDWDKYGPEDFEFRVLLWCSPANLRMYEQACMSRFLSYYNVAPLSDSLIGVVRSAETRAKLSALAKARPNNRTGIPHTEKTKRTMGLIHGALTEDQVREIRARRGRGEAYASIAADFPVSKHSIFDACHRRYKWVK